MTEKQINILAWIMTIITVVLIILSFKYILAIGILLAFFAVYFIISLF